MTVFDRAWDVVKNIPTDIANDPLVVPMEKYGNPRPFVRMDRDFRAWLYENRYPVDDDFAQLDFMQQMQVLLAYRVQQGAGREREFMEDMQ